MKLKSTTSVVVIGLSEYVIQSGDRKGEVVHRASISDGVDILQDLNLGDNVNVKDIVLFTQPYNAVFDYSVRSYGDKIYKQFSVDSLVPLKG